MVVATRRLLVAGNDELRDFSCRVPHDAADARTDTPRSNTDLDIRKEMFEMLHSLSKRLTVRGLAAIAVGLVALVWPAVTVGAVVFLFAVFAFAEAIQEGVVAFSAEKAGPVLGHLLLGLLNIAAGVVALAWPGITAYVLVIWVGAWAVVTGALEIGMAFGADETGGERAAWAIGGVISGLFGIALFASPGIGALSLAVAFGVFTVALGISQVVLGAKVHQADNAVTAAVPHAA